MPDNILNMLGHDLIYNAYPDLGSRYRIVPFTREDGEILSEFTLTVSSPYPQGLHLQIQPNTDEKYSEKKPYLVPGVYRI